MVGPKRSFEPPTLRDEGSLVGFVLFTGGTDQPPPPEQPPPDGPPPVEEQPPQEEPHTGPSEPYDD
jgi:hypothetical protein